MTVADEPSLVELKPKGRTSVIRLVRAWYPLCWARELGEALLSRRLLGVPLVLFRGEQGEPRALLDRCPHRNVPLSLGALDQGQLTCRYHGWTFDPEGHCVRIPGLSDPGESRGRRVPAYRATERDGLVWVYGAADEEPSCEPFALRHPQGRGYVEVRRMVEAPGTLHATLENALDVPHTAFLHRGLFRGGKPNKITAKLSRYQDHVEIAYLGEPRPEGLLGTLLSPEGGVVQHWDRFFLPSVAQVEYSLGEDNHVLVTAVGTPVDDSLTRLYAVVSLKVRLPMLRWLVPLLVPFGIKIFNQDKAILGHQAANIEAFAGEQFTSTSLDLMGPQIWRLLRQAERGEAPRGQEPVFQQDVEFLA